MYGNVKSEDYKAAFKEAIHFLKQSAPPSYDHHDLAHQALELYFSTYRYTDTAPMKTSVIALLKEKACTSSGLELEIKIDLSKIQIGCDELVGVEATLDLGRLYLDAAEHLAAEDKILFSKIWSLEDLTDDETERIDALGHKIRRILNTDATTATKKLYFKSGIQGKAQIYKWQIFYEQRVVSFAKALKARNRRSCKRFCN